MTTTLPAHIRKVEQTLNNFVGEGRSEVSGSYIPWSTFSDDQKNEIKKQLRIWEDLGFLEIIGDLDIWEPSRVCYTMKNFIDAKKPLPVNWLRQGS